MNFSGLDFTGNPAAWNNFLQGQQGIGQQQQQPRQVPSVAPQVGGPMMAQALQMSGIMNRPQQAAPQVGMAPPNNVQGLLGYGGPPGQLGGGGSIDPGSFGIGGGIGVGGGNPFMAGASRPNPFSVGGGLPYRGPRNPSR